MNIEATVKKVKFLNEVSYWGVIEFVRDDNTKFIARGKMGPQYQGYRLKLSGNWVDNERGGGKVYDVKSYSVMPPKSTEGIYLFLTSGLFGGFTKRIARELVELYGDRTLKLLDSDINIVLTVKGVGPKTFMKIRDSYQEAKPQQERLLELMNLYKFTFSEALLIVSQFPENSLDVIKNAPYSMYRKIEKMPFLRFDQVIMSTGRDPYEPQRIREVILYQVRSSYRDGHTLIPLSALKRRVFEYLRLDEYVIEQEIKFLVDKRRLFASEHQRFGTVLQSKWFYSAEKEIANRLSIIMNTPAEKELVFDPLDSRLETLKSHQRRAVVAPFEHKVSVITGNPGAGKTTLLKTVVKLLESQNLSVLAVSPTGKAAQRLREVTGRDCSTIHRALGATHQSDEFLFNDLQPLDYDVVIVDETSMLDTSILRALLRATPATSRVILIGDVRQLPSVAPGSVFKDIINSGCFAVYWLTEVLRIKKADGTPPTPLVVSSSVCEGVFLSSVPNDDEWGYYPTRSNSESKEVISKIIEELKSEGKGHKDVQVFASVNEGDFGVSSLNTLVKKCFCPDGSPEMEVGDKIMQKENNYDLDVYNGDIGVIDNIVDSNRKLKKDDIYLEATISGKSVGFTKKDVYNLIQAFTITGHKSQGSEYPYVIIAIPDNFSTLMDRFWLYTLITRCQVKAYLVGNQRVIEQIVANEKSHLRQTLLLQKLRSFLPVINIVHK